jgi:hypothetical protein
MASSQTFNLSQLKALKLKSESGSAQQDPDVLEYYVTISTIIEQDLSWAAKRTLENPKLGRRYDNVLVLATIYWYKILIDRPYLGPDAERLLNVFEKKFVYKMATHRVNKELNKRLVNLDAELGCRCI